MIQKNITHILIVRLTALGDIVNTAIVLQIIKKFYALHHDKNHEVKIDWLCEDVFAPLLQNHSDINQVHTINLKKLKKERSFSLLKTEIKKLKQLGNYTQIIDMQGLLKSAIVSRIIGSNIHGYDKSSAREGIASFFYKTTSHINYHDSIVFRNASLASQAIGYTLQENDIRHKEKVLPSFNKPEYLKEISNYLVFVIGASWPSKCYPKEKFAQLAIEISLPIVLVWGNEKEHNDAIWIQQKCQELNYHDIIVPDKLTLPHLSATIEHALMTIGNDTGPTHLAWALNRASITLFGPTNERMIYPTPINRFINSSSDVNINKIDKNDFSIADIPVKKIVALIQEIL